MNKVDCAARCALTLVARDPALPPALLGHRTLILVTSFFSACSGSQYRSVQHRPSSSTSAASLAGTTLLTVPAGPIALDSTRPELPLVPRRPGAHDALPRLHEVAPPLVRHAKRLVDVHAQQTRRPAREQRRISARGGRRASCPPDMMKWVLFRFRVESVARRGPNSLKIEYKTTHVIVRWRRVEAGRRARASSRSTSTTCRLSRARQSTPRPRRYLTLLSL